MVFLISNFRLIVPDGQVLLPMLFYFQPMCSFINRGKGKLRHQESICPSRPFESLPSQTGYNYERQYTAKEVQNTRYFCSGLICEICAIIVKLWLLVAGYWF
ncbi:MAG: hypothetical protein A2Y12_04120 [Planctomycetes bacterium GWF2_42_9]|nr:MAG: hypothetical protein A2Y12_04120 [Planctomycetes bacterium GWF2_42_9]